MITFFSKPKIALCFIISGDHLLNKEDIWREWIEYNKDIIQVYFYYQDESKIRSSWIRQHCIPKHMIKPATYMHVIPAYFQSMKYAFENNTRNRWFCFLTDSCCPIISPRRFRYLFFHYQRNSLMSWQTSWWNPYYTHRANLNILPKTFHLGNSPWFILRREEVDTCLRFANEHYRLYKMISDGNLANESLFAIVFRVYFRLDPIKLCNGEKMASPIMNEVTHLTDWSRMSTSTSPYVFEEDSLLNRTFIEEELKKNRYACFIRKMGRSYPDKVIRYYLYEYSKKKDAMLFWRENDWWSWDHWLIGMFLWMLAMGCILLGPVCYCVFHRLSHVKQVT